MKRFMYFSISVMCLSLAALVGFQLGSSPAQAQFTRPVVGMSVDGQGSTVFVLEADGDVWARRVEYLDIIDGYGDYVPSLSASPPARYLGNFFDDRSLARLPAVFPGRQADSIIGGEKE